MKPLTHNCRRTQVVAHGSEGFRGRPPCSLVVSGPFSFRIIEIFEMLKYIALEIDFIDAPLS